MRAGVTTAELDAAAERFIPSQDAEPSFKGYRGFPGRSAPRRTRWSCTGSPAPTSCKRGDVISIDVGVTKDGWVADAAITLPVGGHPEAAHCSR